MTALLNPQRTPGERRAGPAAPTGLPTPPSGARVIRLLAGAAWRRWRNRLSLGDVFFRRKKATDSADRRQATPGKGTTLVWNSLVIGLVLICLGALYGCSFVIQESKQLGLTAGEAIQEPAAGESAQTQGDDYDRLLQSGAVWPLPPNDRLVVLAVGLALVLLSLVQLTAVLGSASLEQGQAGWDMEWLFTLPVPAWALFLGRVVQYATAGQSMWWCLSAPFLAGVYWCAGYGWWAVPLGLAAMGYGALLTASLGLVVETWVQKKLAPGPRKNLQAVLGLVGGWSFLAFFMLPGFWAFDSLLLSGLSWTPAATWANPFSLPALLCVHGWASVGAPVGMALLGVAAPFGAVRLAGWLVRDGLIAAPGAHPGSRGRRGAALGKIAGLFRGVVGKDLRLLTRDRAFLIRTLVLPVLLFGFCFFQNWQEGIKRLQDAHFAPVLAFWLGALVVGYGAFQVLAAEGGALWLLYTFPRKLQSILLEKTFLWCGLASLYVLAVLATAVLVGMPLDGEVLTAAVFAVVGIAIHAFIAAAIGALAFNPTESVVQRRPRQDLVWLYRFLWLIYLSGIFLPLWPKIVLAALYVPLAFAFWQKVQDRIPYLLEPAESPPPRISLADGMVAALAFFVLQAVLYFILDMYFGWDNPRKLADGSLLLLAEVIDGVLVTMVALFFLRRVPNLLTVTGLVPSRIGPRQTVWGVLATGTAAGVLAGIFAVAYLVVLLRIDAVPNLKEGMAASPSPLADPGWFAVVVLAAPLFEEFLFRGLIFQGLERSMRPTVAVLGSAAIFAAVHPAVSVLPVFVLGVAVALSFRRSRLLWTPVVAHVVYNAIVVLAKLAMVRWLM